ncbi:hypothetical protein FLLO111716_05890 [Flavobacterium longum]|uniref:hypothetical protein n=1 Tax=Flavobacterium longum TaxID=1299340 RepID=UPI0039E745A2
MEVIVAFFWRIWERFRDEIILVMIALGWLFLLSTSIQLKPEFTMVGDDWSYFEAVSKLYFEGLPDEGRPFGIAAIYGLPLLFTDNLDAAIHFGLGLNLCCWLVSILVVHRILTERYNSAFHAFAYSVLVLLCVGNLAIAFRFLPEPVFILLILLAVLFLNRFELSSKTKHLSVALAILCFAMLIKPVATGLAVIVAVCHFRSLLAVVKHKSSVLVYAMLVLVGIQMNEMHKAYGDYKISYIGNTTYYNYLGAKADCYRKNIEFIPGENARAKHFQSFSIHDQQRLVREDIAEQLQNNTFNLIKAYGYCLIDNSSKGSYIVASTYNWDNTFVFRPAKFFFKALSKAQNILLTAIGVVLSVYVWIKRKSTSGFSKILAAITLYVFFVSGISCLQTDRFHLVFFPLVIMMIAECRNKKAGEEPA